MGQILSADDAAKKAAQNRSKNITALALFGLFLVFFAIPQYIAGVKDEPAKTYSPSELAQTTGYLVGYQTGKEDRSKARPKLSDVEIMGIASPGGDFPNHAFEYIAGWEEGYKKGFEGR